MSFSDQLETDFVRYITRNTAPVPAPPATIYVGLYLVVPADDGSGGTEVSTGGGTNYARQPVTTGASGTGSGSGWTDPGSSSGQSANVNDIPFPVSGASYGGAIVGTGLWRTVSGTTASDFIGTGPSTVPTITIASGERYTIPAGTLTITQS